MSKPKTSVKRVVLAYSGGLDTSVILKWLQTTYHCEVVTFTADLGQGEELEPARQKALLLGIKPEHIFIEDLREEFVRDYVFPMFRANAQYEGLYLLGTSIARPLIALTPSGRAFSHAVAVELAALEGFSLLCGRYEGVDERVAEHLVDGELGIGDYVLAGGEAAAVVVVEAVARLVPGVMGNLASSEEESFTDGLLEYPHYTRPAEFRGWGVPEVLLSGHHERVARWRRAAALARTLERRPDLVAARGGLSPAERALLAEWGFDRLISYVYGPDRPDRP